MKIFSAYSRLLRLQKDINEFLENLKFKKKIGFIAPPVLCVLDAMPLILTPNIWGTASKKNR